MHIVPERRPRFYTMLGVVPEDTIIHCLLKPAPGDPIAAGKNPVAICVIKRSGTGILPFLLSPPGLLIACVFIGISNQEDWRMLGDAIAVRRPHMPYTRHGEMWNWSPVLRTLNRMSREKPSQTY